MGIQTERKEHLVTLPRWVEDWFVENVFQNKNRKNLPLFTTIVNISFTTIPAACLLFYYLATQNYSLWFGNMLGMAYVLTNLLVWEKSFILAMHYSSHTLIFDRRSSMGFLNSFCSTVLCAFFGMTPGQYYLHHVVMHHKENNLFPFDVSSTLPYQRNSRWHMYQYIARYFFAIYFQLPYYAWRRQRYNLCVQSILFFIGSGTIVYTLFRIAPLSTIYVFIVPYIVSSYALMEGNFSQHIFVSPDVKTMTNTQACYGVTYSCTESKNNSYTFNDGYHVEHHLYPMTSWADLPDTFDLEEYKKHDGIAFKEIDIDGVRELVMADNLVKLAGYYINHSGRSTEQIVSLFRARLNPVH